MKLGFSTYECNNLKSICVPHRSKLAVIIARLPGISCTGGARHPDNPQPPVPATYVIYFKTFISTGNGY